jgi:hypothetical protein
VQGLICVFEEFLSLLEVSFLCFEFLGMEVVEEIVDGQYQIENGKGRHDD